MLRLIDQIVHPTQALLPEADCLYHTESQLFTHLVHLRILGPLKHKAVMIIA